MKIARILYPVLTLGPGRRLGIWVQGCERYCPGCANPELWDPEGVGEVGTDLLEAVAERLEKQGAPPIEGVTITGGEPFLQPDGLREMMDFLRTVTSDILLYTGFLRGELKAYEEDILKYASVVIDGAYIQEQNYAHPLKGSKNQRIFYRDEETRAVYEAYIQEMREKHLAQTFELREGKAVPGIRGRNFREDFERRIQNLRGMQEGDD